MKTKNLLMLATIAFALQASVMAYMIVKRAITLEKGERFRFRTAPVDPHDAFRGKYLRVEIEGNGPFTNKIQYHRGQQLYTPLSVSAEGIASMESIQLKPPLDLPYIGVKCERCNEQRVKTGAVTTNLMYYCHPRKGGRAYWYNAEDFKRNNLTYTKIRTNTVDRYKYTGMYITRIKVPFDRYYMDEDLAAKAEQVFHDQSRHSHQDAILNVRVRNGYALIESLAIGGRSLRDLAKEK